MVADAAMCGWAAGFLDGEGYFGILRYHATGKPHYRPVIEAAQVAYREPLDRLVDVLGGRVNERPPSHGRTVYRWSLDGGVAVRCAIPLVLPHLTVKRDQAEVVLAYAITVKPRGSQGYTAEEVAQRAALATRVKELRR